MTDHEPVADADLLRRLEEVAAALEAATVLPEYTAWARDVREARARIETLTQDLAANASMLARQCDLARGAESERDSAVRQFQMAERDCQNMLAQLRTAEARIAQLVQEHDDIPWRHPTVSTESKGTEDTGARPAPVTQRLDQLKAQLAAEWRQQALEGIHHDHLSDLAFLLVELEYTQTQLAQAKAGGPQVDDDLLRRLDDAIPNVEWAGQRHVTHLLREARARIAQMTNDAVSAHSGRSLRDSVEAYRVELLESNPPVAHVLGMLLEGCE